MISGQLSLFAFMGYRTRQKPLGVGVFDQVPETSLSPFCKKTQKSRAFCRETNFVSFPLEALPLLLTGKIDTGKPRLVFPNNYARKSDITHWSEKSKLAIILELRL